MLYHGRIRLASSPKRRPKISKNNFNGVISHIFKFWYSKTIRFFEAGGLGGASGVDGRMCEQGFKLECKKPLMS